MVINDMEHPVSQSSSEQISPKCRKRKNSYSVGNHLFPEQRRRLRQQQISSLSIRIVEDSTSDILADISSRGKHCCNLGGEHGCIMNHFKNSVITVMDHPRVPSTLTKQSIWLWNVGSVK